MAADDVKSTAKPAIASRTNEDGTRSGVSLEARLGMCVVVVLLCAFGFLVYRKFDARQQQLLNMTAATLKSADDAEPGLHENVPNESGPENESLQTSFDASDTDPFATRDAPSAAIQPGNSLLSSAVPDQQPMLHEEQPPVTTQNPVVFDFDEPVAFDEPAVQQPVTHAVQPEAQNADPFAVAANAEATRASLFEDFAPAAPESQPAVVADDWAQLAEPEAGPPQAAPFAFVNSNADQTAATDVADQPNNEFFNNAFGLTTTEVSSDEFVADAQPPREGDVITFNGFPEKLAAAEESAELLSVDASGFDDFVPAQAPVPQPPARSTEIAMLELPSFEDAHGEASDSAGQGSNGTTPSLRIEGFDAVDTPAPSPSVDDSGFGSFMLPAGQTASTSESPANPANGAHTPAFNVQEFNYDHGVRQVAHTTEPCDICEVLPNDNYWSISKRAYGTARYFSALALYNQHRISDPKKMRPGMKVLIPEAATLETRYPELFRDYQTKEQLPSGFFMQDNGTPAYRIGERETLSEIAEKHLGRSSRWTQIWRLNKGSLADPNKLRTGSVIILPDDATNVQMRP